MDKRRIGNAAVCAASLLAAAATLLYYVFGPSLAYFHADCTDSLLWAQVTVETGELLSPDFRYAALLPFGSPLWMVPVLKIFGYTMTAQQVSMAVFVLLFLAAAFWCFRTLRFSAAMAGSATFVTAMLLSSSVKLREIMWEHTIYYSLSILFILLLVPLTVRVTDCLNSPKNNRRELFRVAVFSALLWLLCLGCGMDGVQVTVITVVPVAGAWLLQVLLDGDRSLTDPRQRRTYVTVGVMALGVVCGLVALWIATNGGEVKAGYENAFSRYDNFDHWGDNADRFIPWFLSLCGVTAVSETPFVSLESVLTVIKLAAAWGILLLPVVLLFRYRTLKHRTTKVMVLTHLVLSAILLFLFICGFLSNAQWRLTPMVGTGIVTAILAIRELFDGTTVQKRIAVVLAALFVTASIVNAVTVLKMPITAGDNQAKINVAKTLQASDCEYGYATFWNAQSLTLLSDSKVKAVPIEVDANGWSIYHYQIRDAWLEPYATADRVFAVLTPSEYIALQNTADYQRLVVEGAVAEDYPQDGFRVIIFNRDPF